MRRDPRVRDELDDADQGEKRQDDESLGEPRPRRRLAKLIVSRARARVSTHMADYAIISLGGKQYRVREGEKLLVDRLKTDEGKTFHPDILFAGGDGKADFKPKIQVTAKVIGHVKGEKIRIGKYRKRTGYRRHTGYRSSLSQIEITAIGAKSAVKSTTAKNTESKPKAASTTKKKADS